MGVARLVSLPVNGGVIDISEYKREESPQIGVWESYRATAVPNVGWNYVRMEILYKYPDGHIGTIGAASGDLFGWHIQRDGTEYGDLVITAYFEPDTPFHFYTVAIVAKPQIGGVVGGGGSFQYGETCTLTASRNVGYELMRLENAEDGITIYPPNPPQCFGKTITHSFAVTKNSSWTAYFRECTNAILRGKSGNILRGRGGNILRDW